MSDWSIEFLNARVVPIGLMLIMFSLGLTLMLRDFALVAKNPKLVGSGFLTHLLLLPLLGLSIALLFRLPPELALGLFIISMCPAGTTSNALTFVGRGNVALAVILTALTSLVTVFSIPLLLSWAVPWFLGRSLGELSGLTIPGTMMKLAQLTLIPVAAGMTVRRYWPDFAARMARWLRPTALIILIAVIALSVLSSAEMVSRSLIAAAPAILALNVSAMALGLLLGKLLRVEARDAMTLAIETGVQNVTLALYLTLTVLGSLELAVTQNIYGVLMILNAMILIRWWRRRIDAEADGPAAAAKPA